ncbi:MAG: DUF962 domain-containing protein [Xanthomonadales bacterium PRO7]|jgi:uncharacterized membrane protein YGL010W|nr:DUF962 domain-containing protein [Xanthomonadales bacterium PRO7]HMM56229.1 DUF962 domain-containing protein [Rudaea sp.]
MTELAREGGLLNWQWRGYARNHSDRTNLLIHFVAVPVFIAGILAFLTMLLRAQWLGALLAILVSAVAFAVQAVGHKREREAPVPFDGPGDFVARIFAEQFITFPRFVLSGQWARNLAKPSN